MKQRNLPDRVLNAAAGANRSRRRFLAMAAGMAAAPHLLIRTLTAQDRLLVLKDRDVERLRLDFNGNRSKVRLIAVLSPT